MKENDKIRIYRALHGLEQTELARAMGANRPAVAKWEKGVYLPQPDEMSRLGIYNWIRAGSRLDPQFFRQFCRTSSPGLNPSTTTSKASASCLLIFATAK